MTNTQREGRHERLAETFERWIGICLRAGQFEQAEQCRADAELHSRLARKPERKAA